MSMAGNVATSAQPTGASTMPSRNAIRQPISPGPGRNSPPRMPEIPAMRPLSKIRRAAARPISMPPPKALAGVKAEKSIVMSYPERGRAIQNRDKNAETAVREPALFRWLAEQSVERLQQAQHPLVADPVENMFAFASGDDQAFTAQHAELLREIGLP